MASPLLSKTDAALNSSNPTQRPQSEMASQHDAPAGDFDQANSSPFINDTNGTENRDRKNSEPLSPTPSNRSDPSLKKLKIRSTADDLAQSRERNSRRISSPMLNRFPVKVASSTTSSDNRSPVRQSISSHTSLSSSTILRENESLTKAIQVMEDEVSEINYDDTACGFDDTTAAQQPDQYPESFADETHFSNFSAVPDMTMFAKIGHTPTKFASMGQQQQQPGTAIKNSTYTPATLRRPPNNNRFSTTSPTPLRQQTHSVDGDSGNLLDFTEQFNTFSTSSRRTQSTPTNEYGPDHPYSYTQNARTPSPSKRHSQHPTTSSRMSNLLDFDIPPAPTPRSMPSVTPRELESLKSALLSEISSLKASLSGKEAEVMSYKNAIGDAEKRVGESMELAREERSAKEQLLAEKEDWIRRSREMEMVLHNVKEEMVHSERERESLEGRLEESEMRREAAERMAQEAESKAAALRAASGSNGEGEGPKSPPSAAITARDTEIAVEKVARELHALYKSKHETKVAALKKSYEGKWDKKVRELENKLEELMRENEDLKNAADATMSGVVHHGHDAEMMEELREQAAREAQNALELRVRLEGLYQELQSVKDDNAGLRSDLEQERVEKGELVAACDELLALQESTPTAAQQQQQQPAAGGAAENFRASVSSRLPSGLRAPVKSSIGAPASRIGGVGAPRSGSSNGSRPGSGLAGSRMSTYKPRGE